MKRVIQHPTAPSSGRTYWRSTGELLDTPEFREQLEREFPQGIAELEAGVSRRDFVKLLTASMALAGVGLTGCRRPEAHLVPFTKSPEWMIPGRHLHYSTAMPRREGALPLHATSFEGRPTKVEGNPFHTDSAGKTDIFAQASILDLYDPDRARRYLASGKPMEQTAFLAALDSAVQSWKDGSSVAVLEDGLDSPTRARLRAEVLKKFPKISWASHEPLAPGRNGTAAEIAFGEGARLVPQFGKASVVVAVDHDFLSAHESGIKAIRDFVGGRRVRKAGDQMNRLYAIEHRYTVTGGMADHRLRLPASQMGSFLAALALELSKLGVGSGLDDLAAASGQTTELAGETLEWITALAADLAAAKGSALVTVSQRQSVQCQLLAIGINHALGAMGQTLKVRQMPSTGVDTLKSLVTKISAGQIKTLVILGGNPAYTAPSDYEFAAQLASVPSVIYLGDSENETAACAHLFAPKSHYLEAWGDARSCDGSYLTAQPLILPLWSSLSDIQLLARILGIKTDDEPTLVKQSFAAITGLSVGSTDFEAAWKKCLHDGFLAGSAASPEGRAPSTGAVRAWLASNKVPAPRVAADSIEVVFSGDYSVEDGRYNNNGWLQESPDPITKLTWENAALMSATTAKKIGVKNAVVSGILTVDKIRIAVNGQSVEAPALIVPGHADYTITLPLGYGRTKTGRVGKASGFNAYPLRSSSSDYVAIGAQVSLSSSGYKLAITQEHSAMEGRAIVREASLEVFNQDPEFVNKVGIDSHAPPNVSFYKNPPLTGVHQWGMSLDLTTCTGCTACVVACQAENNIPIVGKDQVAKGREMHWIRIDRYYSGTEENAEMLVQPMTCVQCENAPCETVCPVNATVHNEEGLNVMTYNRCIGTRYCANNCPFKVRRFNYFNYSDRPTDKLYWGPLAAKDTAETTKMQRNPNVTVRMRGVMEKCTFCVQRLEAAKIDQKAKNAFTDKTEIPTDSVMTACQQACPTDAIVFGNLNDENSRVVHLKQAPHDYAVLGYLNLKPRVTYLGRIRNINAEMPGAENLVMSTMNEMHHGGAHEPHAEGVKEAGEDAIHETYKTQSNH